jgi:hypothetical protein
MLRFHGPAHEYPCVPGRDVVPGLFGISELPGSTIVDICTRLACLRLAGLGNWNQAFAYCTDLDRLSPPESSDAAYIRGLYDCSAVPVRLRKVSAPRSGYAGIRT